MYMLMRLVHLLHDLQDLFCIFTIVKFEVFTKVLLEDAGLLACYSLLAEFFVGCLVLKMKSPQSFKLSGTAQHQVV
jgi:hypothetical protein